MVVHPVTSILNKIIYTLSPNDPFIGLLLLILFFIVIIILLREGFR